MKVERVHCDCAERQNHADHPPDVGGQGGAEHFPTGEAQVSIDQQDVDDDVQASPGSSAPMSLAITAVLITLIDMKAAMARKMVGWQGL